MRECIKTYMTERIDEATAVLSKKDKSGLIFENCIGNNERIRGKGKYVVVPAGNSDILISN